MIVVITNEAEAELENIGDYIVADNPARAETFVAELIARCEQLAEMSDVFPLVPRYEESGVRRRPYGEYLIFYTVRDETVFVVHVLHGRMDYESLLFP